MRPPDAAVPSISAGSCDGEQRGLIEQPLPGRPGRRKAAVLAGQPESEIAQLLKSHLPRDQLAEETLEAVKSLIETYLAEAVRALRSGAEPSQLCALLALCNQTAVDAATRPSATPAKLTAHPVLQLMQLQ
uniref:BHLH domain-containing protein n=1 Tax=Macrostomum lignano TaxID=282301 RepID=A0A1I8GJM1_9PLAT